MLQRFLHLNINNYPDVAKFALKINMTFPILMNVKDRLLSFFILSQNVIKMNIKHDSCIEQNVS